MNLRGALEQSVARDPDAVAVETADGSARTYAELDDRADSLAAALQRLVGDGRVATLLDNGHPAVESLVAATKRGRGVVPLNVRESPETLAFVVRNADARGLVFDAANADTAAALFERVDLEGALAVGDPGPARGEGVPVEGYAAALDSAGDPPDPHPDDEFGVFHTSGSTGRPKGVVVDGHRIWLAVTQSVMEMGFGPDDVGLMVTPYFHLVTPESWLFPHLLANGRVVVQPHFEAAEAVDLLADREATGVLAVPPQLDAMVEAVRGRDPDLSALAAVRTGGGPLHEDTVEAVSEHLAPAIHNTYGLTEGVGNVTHARPETQRAAPGNVGRASFNWEVRVVDAAGPGERPDPDTTVDRGETGEVLVRGPAMADGYLDRPGAEADLFVEDPGGGAPGSGGTGGGPGSDGPGGTPDRWIRTGDIADLDEFGYLHVVDRVDNMVVTGGENVYPQEVEATLERHPGVREAAVVGVPDDRWGTAVAAVVVGEASAEELDRFCRERDDLADFKRPRRYEFADELPRTPIGKVKRDVLLRRHFESP